MSLLKEYTKNLIQEVGKSTQAQEYNWKEDFEFLRFLTYKITKEALRLVPNDKATPQDANQINNLAYKIGTLLQQEVNFPAPIIITYEDFKKFDSAPQRKAYSSYFTNNEVQECQRYILDQFQKSISNSAEDNADDKNYIMSHLPQDWDEETKQAWVRLRMAKYIASILPMKPWRLLLCKSAERSKADHFLDRAGWGVFREKEDVQDAFREFLDDTRLSKQQSKNFIPKSPELRQAYIDNSRGPTQYGFDDPYPELDYLLTLINEKLDIFGLTSELTRQEVEEIYKGALDTTPYSDKELGNYLDTVVLPTLRGFALQTQATCLRNHNQIVDLFYPVTKAPTKDDDND